MGVSLDGYIAGPGGSLEEAFDLELVETHTFGSRVVYMRYRGVRHQTVSDRGLS